MAEYINAKPLKKEIADLKRTIHSENTDYQTGYMSALSVVEGMIAEQPAANVEPVRRGKWLENEYRHYCSECGHMGLFNGFGFNLESNYCPTCGAKMEEYKSDIT